MIIISWFSLLKMIPSDKFTLAYVISNSKETAKAVEEIKNLSKTPKNLKKLLITVESEQLNLQELKDQFGQPPHGDQTVEQMRENCKKLMDAIGFMTKEEALALINEGLKAKEATNTQRVKEILAELDQKADLSERTLRRNKEIRDKLDILRLSDEKPFLSFDNPPKKGNVLQKFAELLDGELKNNIIFVDFSTTNELIAAMRPSKDKTDSEEVLAKKKELFNIWNGSDGKGNVDLSNSIRTSGWKLNAGGKSQDLSNLITRKKIFVASDKKLTVAGTFSAASVLKYVRAVDNIKGSVRAFKPKKFPNGRSVPSVLLLDKSSPNSMNLNPYAKLILTNDFSGKEWFNKFFDSLRIQQLLTEEEANSLIIDEIYKAILENESSTVSGINVNTFLGKDGITDVKTKTKKKLKAEIRSIIEGSTSLQDRIYSKVLDKQKEQLKYLEDNFTVKEAASFIKLYESLDREDYPMEDLDVEYFKDGRPSAFRSSVLDDEGKETRDEKGSIITQSNKGTELANYATIKLEGDKLTPNDAYAFGMKVTTPEERSTPSEEITLDGKKFKYSAGKEQQVALEAAKKKLAGMSKESKNLREVLETKIKNLERDIKAGIRGRSSSAAKDVGQDVSKLRNELLDVKDFPSYVVSMSKKLKEEGGLISLVSQVMRSASALDQITPERSLGFLSQMINHTGNDEVGEAFNTIDADPESESAKDTANELNDKMPQLLSNMKKELTGAFELKLKHFAENPASYPDNQVILAKKQFVDKENLLIEGE